jgi:hypothetical protein
MNKNCQISKKIVKNTLKVGKNSKFPCYYFSNGITKVLSSFEIRYHGVVNSLHTVLIPKSETREGGANQNNSPFYD